ncbi:MAG TPA: RhuM family protein [Candidatus Sulfotelmatobacter sp.]|nr:RhuM family protein [Candidatus Sulfotelmatobacter sp.]
MSNQETQPGGELILYQTEDGRTRVQCRFEGGTIWLTQAQIAELFQTTPQNVTLHLKAIFTEGELSERATCKEHLQVRPEGGRQVARRLRHYRLEAILAVGYRVRSHRGTQFRQWAIGIQPAPRVAGCATAKGGRGFREGFEAVFGQVKTQETQVMNQHVSLSAKTGPHRHPYQTCSFRFFRDLCVLWAHLSFCECIRQSTPLPSGAWEGFWGSVYYKYCAPTELEGGLPQCHWCKGCMCSLPPETAKNQM